MVSTWSGVRGFGWYAWLAGELGRRRHTRGRSAGVLAPLAARVPVRAAALPTETPDTSCNVANDSWRALDNKKKLSSTPEESLTTFFVKHFTKCCEVFY